MSNPILIHVNRKFHVELDSIIKVVKKRHGSTYVYFLDKKTQKVKIAVAKQDIGTLLMIINTYHLMHGKKQIAGIYE